MKPAPLPIGAKVMVCDVPPTHHTYRCAHCGPVDSFDNRHDTPSHEDQALASGGSLANSVYMCSERCRRREPLPVVPPTTQSRCSRCSLTFGHPLGSPPRGSVQADEVSWFCSPKCSAPPPTPGPVPITSLEELEEIEQKRPVLYEALVRKAVAQMLGIGGVR